MIFWSTEDSVWTFVLTTHAAGNNTLQTMDKRCKQIDERQKPSNFWANNKAHPDLDTTDALDKKSAEQNVGAARDLWSAIICLHATHFPESSWSVFVNGYFWNLLLFTVTVCRRLRCSVIGQFGAGISVVDWDATQLLRVAHTQFSGPKLIIIRFEKAGNYRF